MSTWWPSWILDGTGFQKAPSSSILSSGPQPTKTFSDKLEQVFLSYLMETKAGCMYVDVHLAAIWIVLVSGQNNLWLWLGNLEPEKSYLDHFSMKCPGTLCSSLGKGLQHSSYSITVSEILRQRWLFQDSRLVAIFEDQSGQNSTKNIDGAQIHVHTSRQG
jgi:hypothetical protein